MLREIIPVRSYHGITFTTNRTNKKHLSEDFAHRCAYCNDLDHYGGGFRAYHVEHFAPKAKFPELEYDYDNLLYACPWCNRAKWDTWPSDDARISVIGDKGFIDPCSPEYDNHLERLSDGSIRGITPLGHYMQRTLHLYLKRHAIIFNVDKLQAKVDELKNSITQDHLAGKDSHKKEAALQLVENDFFDYFKMWKAVSSENED